MEAIVYTSNTGFTERYARMLSAHTDIPVFNVSRAKLELPKGSRVIYLGWLFAGKVKGYKKISRRYKVAAVLGVGLGDSGAQTDAVRRNEKIPDDVAVFTPQGGMYFDKLKGVNRFMIKMLCRMLRGKKRTADEDKMLALIEQGGDYVTEQGLVDVYEYLEEIGES